MASFGFVVCLQVNEYYNNTPCKGKSIHYQRFCPYRALCFGCITPRALPWARSFCPFGAYHLRLLTHPQRYIALFESCLGGIDSGVYCMS